MVSAAAIGGGLEDAQDAAENHTTKSRQSDTNACDVYGSTSLSSLFFTLVNIEKRLRCTENLSTLQRGARDRQKVTSPVSNTQPSLQQPDHKLDPKR